MYINQQSMWLYVLLILLLFADVFEYTLLYTILVISDLDIGIFVLNLYKLTKSKASVDSYL